ncbi:MAG: response regulator, partial [Chloroflexota bacterium]
EVLEAVDGPTGWNLAIRERPHLILMDLLLPGLDGFQLARKIKSTPELSHTPIFALTAYGSEEIKHKAEEACFDKFLSKPLDVDLLEAVLRQFFEIADYQDKKFL